MIALELGGRQAAGLRRAWWKRQTSCCARMDTVGPETSDRVRQDMVKVRYEWLCLNGHGWVGGKRARWKRETSGYA